MKSTSKPMRVWGTSKLNLFKCLVAGCGFLLLLPSARAQFTWPVYEPFGEYLLEPQNLGATESMTNWNFGNSSNGTNGVASYVITSTNAMSQPALRPDTNSVPKGVQEVPTSSTSADRGAMFSPQSGTWYTSLLLNYQDNGGATGDRLAYQVVSGATISNSFTRAWTGIWLTPDYRLKVTKNFNASNDVRTAIFSAATPVLATNVPHLIVMRYLKVPGGNDEVDLWLDPAPFGDDASIPRPTITTTNAPNVASFNGFLLSNRKLNGQPNYYMNVFQVDEIRMGSTWSSVTPLATPAPGPMFSVSGGGIGCPGDSFAVILSGSVATNDYWLYTNNVYAGITLAGHADGSALNMGSFSAAASYSILASNNVNGNLAWMSNSVPVYVRAPVTIVGQPSSVITATNNRAQFTVICTGDELSYRWYKGGSPLADDSHLNGSGTSTLVVWPAGTADIGSYYCVITNPCSVSPTTSASVTLTLDAANDLVWSGNSFLNVWDVSNPSYAYFLDTNNNLVVFNGGDNVKFDDSCTVNLPVLLTNILTPTAVTVDAGRDYMFAGNGIVAGSGALYKTGTGTLLLNNNTANLYTNTYAGGTVISNGILNITNGWFNLGRGPLTLAGGTLASWNKGSGSGTAGGLPNDVIVTADSTWQIDRTGDQSAGLVGALIGNAGTKLNIYNSSTIQNSVNRMRLGGVFTNGLTIAGSANSVTTNSPMDIATYNSAGAQVYNGPITGTNTGFLVVGAGAVYLNGANTYTRDTTVYAGFLAGSGSISGQLVVNSGSAIGAGSQTTIGTFTVNSNVTLNGNVRIRVDKSLAQPNDLVSVSGTITNGGSGTVTVTNIGATGLAPGDRFQIFSGPVSNGGTLIVTGGAMGWQNNLAIDGSIQAGTVIASYPTNLSFAMSGTTLSLTWPQSHLGWILQSQTNSLATGLNPAGPWYDIPGTVNVTTSNIPVNSANPAVFYRLRQP